MASATHALERGRTPTQRLLEQEPRILELYSQRLRDIHSPLPDDPDAWSWVEEQARRIIVDCADSLAQGVTVVSPTQIGGPVAPDDEHVMRHGLRLTHFVQSLTALTDLILDAIGQAVASSGVPGPDRGEHTEEFARAGVAGYTAAVRALHQGVGSRLEAGSASCDQLPRSRIKELYEENRRWLAREIHDQFGNSLSLAMRQLEMHELLASRAGTDVGPQIRAAKAAILDALDTSRRLVTALRRPNVSGSLITALQRFAASMGDSDSRVRIWVEGPEERLPGWLSEELFLLVRECLRNALRHAGAGNVVVSVDVTPYQVRAEVIDDGKGFDRERVRSSGGNGLEVMAERVHLLQGSLNISSAPEAGTRVTISLPIEDGRTAGG
ncbi:sensor histidine kinase [Streptomyces sp.]|uniref:sensor histidine kinase n=1 Tax=Streptomyces sp. TaxID=1931 RepID=UPI002F424F06